jgi:endonuclease VIII-like 1
MPEISEVRIMGEFINQISTKVDYFVGISKNPEHKSKTNLSLPFKDFQLKACSRGKELKIKFIDLDFKYEESKIKEMVLTMGMSGNWVYSPNVFKIPKHTHLMFMGNDGSVLGMNDVRRFARWDWRDWNIDRGPDPFYEFDRFKENILKGITGNRKIWNKPIYEVLMNQEYFNGIGNYLRAEILGRICLDPRFPGDIYISLAGEDFFNTLKNVIEESYILGGGQFKDWYNQEDQKGEKWKSFQNWIGYYSNRERCIPVKDNNDRVFWMDKKWNK